MKNPLRNLPKEKIQKLALVVIFTLMIVSAIIIFWIGDSTSSLEESGKKIAELTPQIQDAERTEQAEVKNVKLRQQLTAFVETQRVSIVTGDLFSWALREMSLFAENHSVKIASLRPGQRVALPREGNYETYSVTADLVGQYDAIGQFLCDFENKFPTAQVRSVSMTPGDGTKESRMATVEFAFLIWPDSATALFAAKPKEEPPQKP